MAYQQNYYQTTSLPIAVPHKVQYSQYHTPQTYTYAVSPPEAPESVTTGSGAPSYGNSAYSATSSSYAGSMSGYSGYDDSQSSANNVDMQEYMQDRFAGACDPLPLDRTLAMQTQT
jgi:biogenesis of lysosome-related organelles complex 1 subunit KXD1